MRLDLPPSEPKITRVWSPQQLGVFVAVTTPGGNLEIKAVAGSGKTTTLVECCARMMGRVAFAAYNRKIADEIKVRVSQFGNVTAGTFHSFGLTAWKEFCGNPRVKVESGKGRILAAQLGQAWELRKFTSKALAFAKSAMLLPSDSDDWFEQVFTHHDVWDELDDSLTYSDGIAGVKALLSASIIESEKLIDFEDMLYMPLICDAKFPQYDWVLIDEAQDSNRGRREIASRMLKPGSGRLVAVGDPHQAIYGFTGADNDAMEIIRAQMKCEELPLTVSYRCPQAVVRHAQKYVSHIEAAPDALEGHVHEIDERQFWKDKDLLQKDDAILCRNTKPLIDLAFELIRNNIGCHVEGREIGESLIKLVEKFKSAGTLAQLTEDLHDYKVMEMTKLINKGQDAKAAGVEDRVDTLLVVIESLNPWADPLEVKLKLSVLFGDTTPGQPSPSLTLATIHKSKGREWDRVWIWGANKYQPSRFAKKDWQKQQETNLRYVSITRAKKELVEVIVL
jgi:DNA helicase-2/ATP-dependent DNA helicase PcrA